MLSTIDELMTKTQTYWYISSVWNGRIKSEVQTGDALEACSNILMKTNFERPLSNRVLGLQDELIEGGSKTILETKVIPFKARA